VREAAERVDQAAPEAEETAPGAPAGPGDHVHIAHLGLEGRILAVQGDTVTVQAGAVTVRVPRQGVRVITGSGRPTLTSMHSREAGPRPAASGGGRVSVPGKGSVAGELHLIGKTTDEARDLLEEYLDDAFLAGLTSVRIIHGKGTGALRRAVEELLSSHPLVTEHRPGAAAEGGTGATVAVLGQS
jgi:DNA mismatch repair protein MutS2